MNEEVKSEEQLYNISTKFLQKNFELETAQKNQDENTAGFKWLPGGWFATGRPELYTSEITEEEDSAHHRAKYKFSDLVDIKAFEELLKSFYEATGIPYGLEDENNNIISGIGWQDICTRFHRACRQTEYRCRQSDRFIRTHLYGGSYAGYKCMNGLIDYAAPIIVEGQHLATIFLGQFLHEPPNEKYFRSQAKIYGFNEEDYLEALRRVPVIPEEQVKPIINFYAQLGQVLAKLGLERKRQIEASNQAMREQQERLNLIWKMSHGGFWDWNILTGEIYASPRMTEMLEYSPEEYVPTLAGFYKIIHPDDIAAVKRAYDEYIAGQSDGFEAEYRMLTKSGEWKWFMLHGQLTARDEIGQPLRMVGTKIDITSRKQGEAALLQSEMKFTTAFKCNPDLMAISTLAEGRYVEVNDAFTEITGYERHEVIGRTVDELGIWAIPENREHLIREIQERGSIRGSEMELRTKSGESRTLSLSGEIIHINGKPHLLNSSKDITGSKQMLKALRFSEECFSKAFNNSPLTMSITTLDEGRIIKINKAFCRMLNYDKEDLIGRTTVEIGLWGNLADRCQVKKSLAGKKPVQNMEIIFYTRSGEERQGLLSAEPLDVDGEPCVLAILTDITELRKMEFELARLDRLNLVGEMAASIGHEIRNPMTTVRGYLQLLRGREEYSQEASYFDLMIEELDRANMIITEFLSLAKNKVVELKPDNLNDIISAALPLVQARALSENQYIKLRLDHIPELLLDRKEIHQLILNLVYNGLESMSAPGDVTISTFVEKEKVVLAVQDHGHGIKKELLDEIGTPFFTTKEQGTGLGLAVCYRIANRHNAQIDFRTSAHGTTFYIRFPSPVTP